MKEKTAKKKPRNHKDHKNSFRPRRPQSDLPAEWLYLTPQEVTLRQLYERFRESDSCRAELWEEAGALELMIPEAGSVDLELLEEEPDDEALASFCREQGTRSMFAVTVRPDAFDLVRPVMEEILRSAGGVFCADTEDLTPRVSLTD